MAPTTIAKMKFFVINNIYTMYANYAKEKYFDGSDDNDVIFVHQNFGFKLGELNGSA